MCSTPHTTPNSVPNITPIPTPNNTSDPVPTITVNPELNTTPIELKSPKKEGDDDLNTGKKKLTRTSNIWDHFTKVKGGNSIHPKCTCNYCGADYACHDK